MEKISDNVNILITSFDTSNEVRNELQKFYDALSSERDSIQSKINNTISTVEDNILDSLNKTITYFNNLTNFIKRVSDMSKNDYSNNETEHELLMQLISTNIDALKTAISYNDSEQIAKYESDIDSYLNQAINLIGEFCDNVASDYNLFSLYINSIDSSIQSIGMYVGTSAPDITQATSAWDIGEYSQSILNDWQDFNLNTLKDLKDQILLLNENKYNNQEIITDINNIETYVTNIETIITENIVNNIISKMIADYSSLDSAVKNIRSNLKNLGEQLKGLKDNFNNYIFNNENSVQNYVEEILELNSIIKANNSQIINNNVEIKNYQTSINNAITELNNKYNNLIYYTEMLTWYTEAFLPSIETLTTADTPFILKQFNTETLRYPTK